jgi:tripartite-type tricarboxylate transporter receptor subunit TctC
LLNSELGRMLQVAEIAARLKSLDLEPAPSSPEGFGRRIASDIAMWSKVVKAGNIKP